MTNPTPAGAGEPTPSREPECIRTLRAHIAEADEALRTPPNPAMPDVSIYVSEEERRLLTAYDTALARAREAEQRCEWAAAGLAGDALFGPATEDALYRKAADLRTKLAEAERERDELRQQLTASRAEREKMREAIIAASSKLRGGPRVMDAMKLLAQRIHDGVNVLDAALPTPPNEGATG